MRSTGSALLTADLSISEPPKLKIQFSYGTRYFLIKMAQSASALSLNQLGSVERANSRPNTDRAQFKISGWCDLP